MSGSKHTPGPWNVRRVPYGQACSACDHVEEIGTKLVIHSGGKWVAEIAPPEGEAHPTPTNIANAQLAIAAPELLAGLQLVLKAFELPDSEFLERMRKNAGALRFLIAKAEGSR